LRRNEGVADAGADSALALACAAEGLAKSYGEARVYRLDGR
jgi:hypothetical protein